MISIQIGPFNKHTEEDIQYNYVLLFRDYFMKYSSRGFLQFHFHKIATESFYKTSKLWEVHD